jgi:hypothetical protein
MPKPMLIPFIPPVTFGSSSTPVVANLFDTTGNFRQRNWSFKKRRFDGGESDREEVYDLNRDATTAVPPTVPKLDIGKIWALMVRANESATAIRARLVDGCGSAESRELADSSIALLELFNAVVEEGIIPLSSSTSASPGAAAATARTPPTAPVKPKVEPGTAELRAAMIAAEKSAVIFDANLGPSPVANRAILNNAFAAGLKVAATKVADSSGGDVAESIRVVNDALSCANNMEFLGQSTTRKIDKRDPANPKTLPFCSMPFRIDFPDRNTRIHFERTLRKHCDLKASISLPKPLRQLQAVYLSAVRALHPGKIVMVRPETAGLSLVAFIKEDGERGWTRCPDEYRIPRGIMLPGFDVPSRIVLKDSQLSDRDANEEALLVDATVIADSQS